MEIRGSSWHYKYVAKRWTNDPEALCWYFWKVVLTMIGMLAVGMGMTVLVLGAFFLLALPILQWFINYDPDLQGAAFVVWLAIGVIAFTKYRIYLYDTHVLKRKQKVYKEPGLMSQYLHAKHRKICPLLEYKRGE